MDTPTPRKPIVDTICQDVGGGFLMAGVFGSAYHFANGGIKAVYKNVPRASCSLAVFFGLYGAIDYAMVSARRKEEPVLNCAVAMAGASALTDLPKGLRYAGYSALIGGALGGVLTAGLKLLEDGSRPQVGDPGIPAPSACKSCGREDP